MDGLCKLCGNPLKLLFTSWYCDCEEPCVGEQGDLFLSGMVKVGEAWGADE